MGMVRRDVVFREQPDLFSQPVRVVQPQLASKPRQERPERAGTAKRAAVLARLKEGAVSCYDADHIVHRGQAVIGDLKDRGHIIETVNIDGQLCYVYRDYRPRVKVTQTMQEAYYATPHWRQLARQRKERDGFRCVQCGCKDNLQTHHWRYNLFAESLENDLVTLCEPCHTAVHIAVSGSSVHFPRRIDEATAARLRGEA